MIREMEIPGLDRTALVDGARCADGCSYRHDNYCYAFVDTQSDPPEPCRLLVRGSVKLGYCRCPGCRENQRLFGLREEANVG